MKKSILEMIGGENILTHIYDIKAENTSCYNSDNKSFTGIEVDGVRFANIGKMLRYMNMQRDRIVELTTQVDNMKHELSKFQDAKTIIHRLLNLIRNRNLHDYITIDEAERFMHDNT